MLSTCQLEHSTHINIYLIYYTFPFIIPYAILLYNAYCIYCYNIYCIMYFIVCFASTLLSTFKATRYLSSTLKIISIVFLSPYLKYYLLHPISHLLFHSPYSYHHPLLLHYLKYNLHYQSLYFYSLNTPSSLNKYTPQHSSPLFVLSACQFGFNSDILARFWPFKSCPRIDFY